MSRVNIGGQAVMEGVMMKGPKSYAVAVRKPDQEIEVDVKQYVSFSIRHKWTNVPILRGIVNFLESLIIGMKTLAFSGSFYEEVEEKKKQSLGQKIFGDRSEDIIMGMTMLISLIIGIGIFMVLPYFIVSLAKNIISSSLLLGLLEGALRLIIFLSYLLLISKMEDIQRVFMYHGAEHKTINCLEHGDELTVENVRKHSRLHKRCGTSFIFIVMLVSIALFLFIRVDSGMLRVVYRILLTPVIAGISYEFIRYAGRSDSRIAALFSQPGMMMQRLTTSEPDDSMIEVAIRSVEGIMDWREYLKDNKI